MRKPTRPLTRPLLFAGAGLAVMTMAAGCFTSGNLVAPPPCPDGGDSDVNGQCTSGADGGADAGVTDAGVDAGP